MAFFQVVIVPGYGVAVSKAQYALAELVELLSKTFGKKINMSWLVKPYDQGYRDVGFLLVADDFQP